MSSVIKIENLSKFYNLEQIGTGSLARDLHRKWAKYNNQIDPYAIVGQEDVEKSNIVWSLKDLNFEIENGDIVGIIGKNGAGKSTLLKIISRITSPSTGSVKIKGRVASLLEVGTGFHPELTGKENIFLNGAIIGMTVREIKSKFDEIVDFSGVERYIDTPVKRYSSGMYVRLAFAVAAHLDSEILIVDEVLAVGDIEFQKKCLNKMNSLSNENGRTLLFVSHNIDAIQKLCNNCMHLEKGKLISFGQKNQIIDSYLKKESTIFYYNHTVHPPISDLVVKLNYFDIRNLNNVLISDEKITKAIKIFIEYEILSEGYKPEIGLAIKDYNDIIILHLTASSNNYLLGIHRCEFEIPANLFNNIKLKISCGITTYAPIHHHLHHEIYFEFNDDFESITRGNYPFGYNGKLRPSIKINNY